MSRVIRTTLRKGLSAGLEELGQLAWALWRRREDILAYVGVGASNGPIEATNGRLEYLRRQRPGIPEHGPPHFEVTDPLWTAEGPNQRTLYREEPLIMQNICYFYVDASRRSSCRAERIMWLDIGRGD